MTDDKNERAKQWIRDMRVVYRDPENPRILEYDTGLTLEEWQIHCREMIELYECVHQQRLDHGGQGIMDPDEAR